MYRFVWVLAFTSIIALAGCKGADSPHKNEGAKRKKATTQAPNQPKVVKPERPKVVEPEQPPVVGERNVADADRDELIQCLGHEDMAIRQEAADRLRAQGPDAIAPLIEALDDENYHVRAGAVFALSLFGPEAKSASAKLEELAEEDDWEAVRSAAKFALQSINEEV